MTETEGSERFRTPCRRGPAELRQGSLASGVVGQTLVAGAGRHRHRHSRRARDADGHRRGAVHLHAVLKNACTDKEDVPRPARGRRRRGLGLAAAVSLWRCSPSTSICTAATSDRRDSTCGDIEGRRPAARRRASIASWCSAAAPHTATACPGKRRCPRRSSGRSARARRRRSSPSRTSPTTTKARTRSSRRSSTTSGSIPISVLLCEGYNDLAGGGVTNVQVFRHDSPIFRLTGYMPIFPIIFKEKSAAMLNGGDVGALTAAGREDGVSCRHRHADGGGRAGCHGVGGPIARGAARPCGRRAGTSHR